MKSVKRLVLCLLLQVFWQTNALAQESVFVGRALQQRMIKHVVVPCPENSVCLGSWYRWSLRVEKLISGAVLPDSFVAVRIDSHSYRTLEQFSIFTVKPIESREKRALLGADYVLVDVGRESDRRAATLPAID